MNEWELARAEYHAAEVPQELDTRVRSGIGRGEEKRRRRAGRRKVLRISGAAAACFAAVFIALNVSPAFAAAAGDLPVLGGFFRVMTVRSLHAPGEDVSYDVDVPGMENGDDYTDRINAEIQKRVDEKVAEGNQIVQEYKKAFFETGGTQEEWDERDNEVSVTYAVKSQTDTGVSFVIDSSVSVASAYRETFFYNLDLENDRELTLQDLLGDDWIGICNESIRRQITVYPLEPGEESPFFASDMGGFGTVDENTDFYIDEDGNPVVVFPRASIAVGAMGAVEFEIAG